MEPTDQIDRDTWVGIMHLPDDVALRTSDHNGAYLKQLYALWGDWVEAIGDPDQPDEIYNCMLDGADCLQCATFDLLHGYYRAAIANLRAALELVMIGCLGELLPNDARYLEWKLNNGQLTFGVCRDALSRTLGTRPVAWIMDKPGIFARAYSKLCEYTHSRPNASDGAIWQSNGPVYCNEGVELAHSLALRTYSLNYLLVGIARPRFVLPASSHSLFGLYRGPDQAEILKAYKELGELRG